MDQLFLEGADRNWKMWAGLLGVTPESFPYVVLVQSALLAEDPAAHHLRSPLQGPTISSLFVECRDFHNCRIYFGTRTQLSLQNAKYDVCWYATHARKPFTFYVIGIPGFASLDEVEFYVIEGNKWCYFVFIGRSCWWISSLRIN